MIISTERLSLSELSLDHAPFMFYLMNSPQWKEFIGDRSIHSVDAAVDYVQKIIDTPKATYWIMKQRDSGKLIGIVTFMKRDYLDHFDIGFALIPEYFGKGLAFEATSAVLDEVVKDESHKKILATTLPTNKSSIQLLEKLGLKYDREFESNGEILQVYSMHV